MRVVIPVCFVYCDLNVHHMQVFFWRNFDLDVSVNLVQNEL